MVKHHKFKAISHPFEKSMKHQNEEVYIQKKKRLIPIKYKYPETFLVLHMEETKTNRHMGKCTLLISGENQRQN